MSTRNSPSLLPRGSRHRRAMPRAFTVAALALSLAATAAQAQIRNEGNGSYDVAPMYRALTYAYIWDGTHAVEAGVSYVDNVAPLVNATEIGRLDMDGATAWYTGSAQYAGFFASRNYASMTVNNAQANHWYYLVAGQGTTTTIQFFDATVAAQRAVFKWNVTGTSSNPTGGQADGRIDFHATTEAGRSWLDLFDGGFQDTLFEYGPGQYEYLMPQAPLGTPIYMFFWASAFVEVGPGHVTPGSNFTVTADFANTTVLESIELYDADDNLITDWLMTDTVTGTPLFDATGRLVPVAPPAVIPEPGTWMLMAGGVALLGWLQRRRRHGLARG